MPENRLRHADLRIMVDVMSGAMADQNTSQFLDCIDKVVSSDFKFFNFPDARKISLAEFSI